MVALLVNSLIGGGAERIALTLLNELNKKGVKLMLICIEKEQTYPVPDGVEVVYLTNFQKLHNPIIKMFWVFISAYRLSKCIKKHNVTLVQSHLIRANFINTLAKYFGTKHKSQIVSHLPIDFSNDRFPVRQIQQKLYSWLYGKADELVSISKMMKSELDKNLSLSQKKVKHTLIYNPHNIARIINMAKEETDDFHFSPAKRYLISAGRLVKHKRVEDILQALVLVRKQQPNTELIILGQGLEKEALKAEANRLEISSYVHFLGHLPNPFALFRQSDLFVMASEMEGLPNIIIESLVCKLPVISSDCISGPREILSPSTDFAFQLKDDIEYAEFGVLFPVGKSELLAAAILDLLADEDKRKQYAEIGFEHAKQYDKKLITDKYLSNFYPEYNGAKQVSASTGVSVSTLNHE